MADDQRPGPTQRAAATARAAKGQGRTRGTRTPSVDQSESEKRRRRNRWSPSYYFRSYFGPPEAVGIYYRRTMICQVIAVAIGLLVTLPLMYLLFDREPVFRLTHIWIEPGKVMPGQAVYVVLNGIEFRDCPGVINRMIIDSTGRIYTYASEPRQLETVKTETHIYKLPFVLPLGLAPGQARYRSVVHRWCNWLQRAVWPISSTYEATFEVVGDSEQH